MPSTAYLMLRSRRRRRLEARAAPMQPRFSDVGQFPDTRLRGNDGPLYGRGRDPDADDAACVIHSIQARLGNPKRARHSARNRTGHFPIVIPAKEAVLQSARGWINALRPSRPRCARHLRMRYFYNAINSPPHAEEPPQAASRSTHVAFAALFIRSQPIS